MSKDWKKKKTGKTAIFFLLIVSCIILFTANINAVGDPYKYSLCDIRVAYIYENTENIDWPILYYLNDNYGCRIDLISLRPGNKYQQKVKFLEDKEIYLFNLTVDETDSLWAQNSINRFFIDRYPDIVIFGDTKGNLYKEFEKAIIKTPQSSSRLFNIQKVYKYLIKDNLTAEDNPLILNGRELYNKYKERIEYEIPKLLPHYSFTGYKTENLIRYKLLKSETEKDEPEVDFVSGIELIRLLDVINRSFPPGPKKGMLYGKAVNFLVFFNQSRNSFPPENVNYLVDGYRSLTEIVRNPSLKFEESKFEDFAPYLKELYNRVEKSSLKVIGINWDGKIFLRDSPHGPVAKIRISLSVDSPLGVTFENLTFHPYWDTNLVRLSDAKIEIHPHQTFEREYLVDIDKAYLEATRPESLLFSAEITSRKNRMTFYNSFPVYEKPDIKVRFIPDFKFISPFKDLDIDRVVSSMNTQIEIIKPKNFSDTVKLQLETPRGMFAGSYRNDIYLEKGTATSTIRIPFTISNLFKMGIQHQYIKLYIDGKLVAADTGLIRVASSHISDKVQIGFLADTSGLFEDIIRMTDANFQPLTNRTIEKYDLNIFDVIVIGSGSFRAYNGITKIKRKFENYLRQGGSVVLFGQPDDWPESVLPVGFVPMEEYLNKSQITNCIMEARVLSNPFQVSDKNLFSSFYNKKRVISAVITPAEIVYRTPNGGALLSVTRIGDGQIIYCGLPLLEMVSHLDIDAIHLLANILNY